MNKEYSKNCPKCGEIQKYKTKSILLQSIKKNTICKKCKSKNQINKKPFEKKCPKCKKLLTYTRHYTLLLSIKENWKCKECCDKRQPIYTPEEIKERKKESNKISSKKYWSKPENKNNWSKPENKNKRQLYGKEYRQKPEIKLRNKKYHKQKHVVKKKNIYMKDYNSRPEVKIRTTKYRKEYIKRPEVIQRKRDRTNNERKNPIVRLSHNFAANMRGTLKRYTNKKVKKNGIHWENIVGYTTKDLKEHIEKLFLPGMSWNNYGKWHLDHIIPKSFFVYTSTDDVEFKYCWSLDNLQPLWAKDNISKHDKVTLWGKEVNAKTLKL